MTVKTWLKSYPEGTPAVIDALARCSVGGLLKKASHGMASIRLMATNHLADRVKPGLRRLYPFVSAAS
ncbi:hypothetical protein [Hoeflea prorocentri]|uniref:Uncharacterized protein n=1 Tax=Hoeflea prorocentri TaxID=1922333 RepID=A0A9X3UL75_9HYPH|nr:hypothetical protein [Hoeflea prorocentri]MCY6382674.1 hypothetical protein [Hoeflea prorocentri]MDA5400474.1 hypothetical protein [Hoeflea prorocentri]